MPKYRNDSGAILVVDGSRLEKNETLTTYKTLSVTGLTEVSSHPKYNPVLLSEIYTGGSGDVTEITIPYTSNGRELKTVKVSIFCKYGAVDVAVNDNQNTPRTKLGQGDVFELSANIDVTTGFIINFNQTGSRVDVNIVELN